MRKLYSKLFSLTESGQARSCTVADIRIADPTVVDSFPNLVRMIAKISYNNPRYVLFFRGQRHDHKLARLGVNAVEGFYPSIYRSATRDGRRLSISEKFDLLKRSGDALVKLLKNQAICNESEIRKLKKFPETTWAILQHYRVCGTPLIDVSSSLRVAASFALNNHADGGFLYVFGLTHLSSSITYSVEEELLNIRLQSVCPPQAERPYFQEGHLIGSFPSSDKKKHSSLDLGQRLIAKFKLAPANSFWNAHYQPIPDQALEPENDQMRELCSQVLTIINK